jgi:hypothetical protein
VPVFRHFFFHPSDKFTSCRGCVCYGFPFISRWLGIHPSDKFTSCRGCALCRPPAGAHPSDKFTSCRGCANCGFPFISRWLGIHPSDKFTSCIGCERCGLSFITRSLQRPRCIPLPGGYAALCNAVFV